MNSSKRFARVLLAAACLAWTAPEAVADEKLKVVCTTTYFAEILRAVGGDRVEVRHVAPPRFNVHFVQPRPSDVKNIRAAGLFAHAGLDLESWSDALVEAAGRPELFRGGKRNLDLSHGIRLLEVPEGPLSRAEGDIHAFGNPHYHMNPENAKTVAATAAAKLIELDPAGKEAYEAGLKAFLERLDAKLVEWKATAELLAGKEFVSYHKDMAYFADFLGMRNDHFLEPKPGIPPTPKHVSGLEAYMREAGVKAVAMAAYYPDAVAGAVAARTGARVVVIAQNPGEVPGTDDIFSFFDYNVNTMKEAVSG